MRKKDPVEMARERALKAYRHAIRLKYSLLADEEINATLPEVEAEFNKAVEEGRPYELEVGSAISEVFDA